MGATKASESSGNGVQQPIKKVGALLKRLGTEILENETIELGENVFNVGQKASYELKADNRGFSIELSYAEPPKEE